jgi:iron-sulfur cluster repair protein YtfE (RIC family)
MVKVKQSKRKEMENLKELERALRLEIKKHLVKCDAVNTPNIYKLLREKGGYGKIEEMIISKIIHDRISIGACIAQIESELI